MQVSHPFHSTLLGILNMAFNHYYRFYYRAYSGMSPPGSDVPNHGLVRDGTPCGDHLICLNQTCVSIFPHVDQTKCPSTGDTECSGQGVSNTTIFIGLSIQFG